MQSSPRRKHKPDKAQETLWQTAMDPAVLAVAAQVEKEFRDPVAPELQRSFLRDNLTLRAFYGDWMVPEREKRVASGDLSAGTLAKDRQALNRWDRASRPADWPEDKDWPGLPLGAISGRYVSSVLARMRDEMGEPTMRSTWSHLRSMFNYAVKVRILDQAPKPERRKPVDQKKAIYRDDQIEAAYRALAKHVELQVAFVLAVNAGPRSIDIFLLKWDDFDLVGDRPTVHFFAIKTQKWQTVPLAPLTIAHLKRLPSLGKSPYLFPTLSSHKAKDPERSYRARRRKELMTSLLRQAGITFERPIQTARRTCNTRLNKVREGSGTFVLGHGLTLNAKHYTDPTDLIFEAVNSVEQPACFLDF